MFAGARIAALLWPSLLSWTHGSLLSIRANIFLNNCRDLSSAPILSFFLFPQAKICFSRLPRFTSLCLHFSGRIWIKKAGIHQKALFSYRQNTTQNSWHYQPFEQKHLLSVSAKLCAVYTYPLNKHWKEYSAFSEIFIYKDIL